MGSLDRILTRIKQRSYLVLHRQVESHFQAKQVGVAKWYLSIWEFGIVRVKSRFGHGWAVLLQARRGSMNWQRRWFFCRFLSSRSTIRSRREGSRRRKRVGCWFWASVRHDVLVKSCKGFWRLVMLGFFSIRNLVLITSFVSRDILLSLGDFHSSLVSTLKAIYLGFSRLTWSLTLNASLCRLFSWSLAKWMLSAKSGSHILHPGLRHLFRFGYSKQKSASHSEITWLITVIKRKGATTSSWRTPVVISKLFVKEVYFPKLEAYISTRYFTWS